MPGPLSVHQLTRDSVLGPDPLSPCDALPDGWSVATELDMAVGETRRMVSIKSLAGVTCQ